MAAAATAAEAASETVKASAQTLAEAEAAAAQLRKLVHTAVKSGLQKQVKQALFAGANGLLRSSGHSSRSLGSLAKQLDHVEEMMVAKLSKDPKKPDAAVKEFVARFTGGGGGLRAQLLHSALHEATKYKVSIGGVTGSVDMIKLAWLRSRTELVKDENQLSYLLEALNKLQDITVTNQTWKDVGESWQAVLKLRSQLEVERGQAVLECICADEQVLLAIGAAEQLTDTQGEVPNDVLTLLNKGPSAHIRSNAYKYRKMLDAEFARVRRVKEIQLRVVAGIGTGAATALLAVGNIIGRVYNQLMVDDGEAAAIVAGAVVAALVLCCLCVGGARCYWSRRARM